jgi:hypothetical protein
VVTVIREFGFDTPELSEGLFLKEKSIVRMGMPPIRIEIVTSISGVSFEECFVQRIVDTIDSVPANLIDLHHLKINKKASGRHKALNDLEHLP